MLYLLSLSQDYELCDNSLKKLTEFFFFFLSIAVRFSVTNLGVTNADDALGNSKRIIMKHWSGIANETERT